MSPTPRGQRTRALIIERTAAVFDQQGFAGATLNNLVQATGLTRGAFYFHFDSKDALAQAIVAAQQERWLPVVAELQDSEPDPLRRLIRLTFRSGAMFQTDLVMRAGARLLTERSLIRRELWRSYPWWIDTIGRLLAAAQPDLADVSRLASAQWPRHAPDDVPRAMVALAEHLVSLWLGIQQQVTAAGAEDLPDRLRAAWIATLPCLCRDAPRCQEMMALVEELSVQMREERLRSADDRSGGTGKGSPGAGSRTGPAPVPASSAEPSAGGEGSPGGGAAGRWGDDPASSGGGDPAAFGGDAPSLRNRLAGGGAARGPAPTAAAR